MSDETPCAFCEQPKPLQVSHVVPSFVYRWLKDTSATGYLRYGQRPNQRAQDGLKCELLCRDCEALFNGWETPFALNLFHPYHSRTTSRFEYKSWMSKCLTSICWRALIDLQRQGNLRQLNVNFGSDVDAALLTWKAFLREERRDIGEFELHVLPLDEIAETDGDSPPRIHRYLLRAVQIDRIWTQQSAFVVVKLARLLVIGFIREPERAFWSGTKIDLETGAIAPGLMSVPNCLLNWVAQQAERISEIDATLSSRQEAKIQATVDMNPERAMQSETMAALAADIRLSSRQADHNLRSNRKSMDG